MGCDVLALIPARAGSKGIPQKNTKRFALGMMLSPLEYAIRCSAEAAIPCWVTSDDPIALGQASDSCYAGTIQRPAELAQDDTPMIDVVKHALEQIPGPPDQIILLIQPTQPLRQPKHLRAAIELLESSGADSVVSVVEVPPQHIDLLWIDASGRLARLGHSTMTTRWQFLNRQDLKPVYVRDGTSYCFWRKTVESHGNLYGSLVMPLIIPPEDTCPLDTPEDWENAERRLRARHD